MYHPDAFATLGDAFDPRANAAYAGRFLNALFADGKDWARAIGAYHSETPALGDAYRVLVPNLRQHLEPNGAAVLELGQGQAIYVSECAREAGLRTTLRLDLAAIPRAIVLTTRDREKIVWQS